MATGGGPSKPPPSPHPEIDNIVPHLEFEINVTDDSDGIILNNNAGGVYMSIPGDSGWYSRPCIFLISTRKYKNLIYLQIACKSL